MKFAIQCKCIALKSCVAYISVLFALNQKDPLHMITLLYGLPRGFRDVALSAVAFRVPSANCYRLLHIGRFF